jgi:hypothetical protein
MLVTMYSLQFIFFFDSLKVISQNSEKEQYHGIRSPWLQGRVFRYLTMLVSYIEVSKVDKVVDIIRFNLEQTSKIFGNKDEHAISAQFSIFFEVVSLLLKIELDSW